MITFQNISEEKPFLKFREEYERALLSKQLIIEAMCVSSYCNASKTVDSRYVNLKISKLLEVLKKTKLIDG